MKKLFTFTLTLLAASFLTSKTFAQTEESRNKIQMVVTYGGKTITTDLNSLSTSLSRSTEEEVPAVKIAADTSKVKVQYPLSTGSVFYLTLDAKQLDTELIKLFSKKSTRFDGTITVTDTYGKHATKVIKFKQAALYNYSDQYTSASYNDTFGSSVISLMCKEISINGITIEQ